MGGGRTSKLTSLAVALALGATLATSLGGPAQAAQDTLLPPGFFEHTPTIGNDNIAITADTLTYDSDNHRVIAVGDVQIDYKGDRINGDRLVFDQVTHTAHFVGDVVVMPADMGFERTGAHGAACGPRTSLPGKAPVASPPR